MHGRGRRGSGRRRLRELTRTVVETMEILEDVRAKHTGVGGMSRALVKVVKLGLQTCLQEADEGGSSGGSGGGGSFSSSSAVGGAGAAAKCHTAANVPPPATSLFSQSGAAPSSAPYVSGPPETNEPSSSKSGGGGSVGGSTRGNNNVFVEGGGSGAGTEELLPLGVASVLWELECCAAQARITLMNLDEGRPNHFGVFRAGVYVEEMRMLEAKVLDLVEQALNPPEEKNASLETTVASGIRNCVARLWWWKRAGENAETMTWEAFQEAFQADFGEQIPKTLDVLKKHIAVRGDALRDDAVRPPPPPPQPRRSKDSKSEHAGADSRAAAASEASVTGRSRDLALPSTLTPVTTEATEATANASASRLTSAGAGADAGSHAGAARATSEEAADGAVNAAAATDGGIGAAAIGSDGSAFEVVVPGKNAGTIRTPLEKERRVTSSFGHGISRLLSSVRREWDMSRARAGTGDSGRSHGSDDHSTADCRGDRERAASWRVTAARYEEVTWAHGGLYEAFQALADPRRVVFSMGVVDDGPHEGGGGGGVGTEGWGDAGPVVVQGLLGLSVKQVCCGGQHAAVLTDCGEIFTWGRGGFGRLGHGNRDGTETPKRIEALRGMPCVQVACGFAYTAAVTASGDLYTWGAGENGRLGLGDGEDRHSPSRVEGLHSKVREVYAGSVHSCVLTREGTVYAFGKHEYTGHGDKEDVLEPRLILAFSGGSEALVRQISVGPGGYHTMALTCQGQVYAWGHNRVAQLGIGNSFTVPKNVEGAYFLPNPQLVDSLLGMNIVKVVAGWGHSAALTKDGQLYVCGRNFQGQLGLGNPQRFPQNERGHPFQAHFCLIEKLSHLKIRQIACGGEHSVAVAENGEVWSFGAGQKGQLGHESTEREHFPRMVQALKRTRREILHVACGNNCTLVLAGGVAFPSLFERAAAVIRGNSKLWADVESLELLPPSVVDSLSRTAVET